MESDDVIELGSSDDEAEPPMPKKIKPLPNAMVHIPIKLQGITKPTVSNMLFKHKELRRNSLSITKVPSSITTNSINAHTNKPHGKHLQKSNKVIYRKLMSEKSIPSQQKLNINPISVITRGSTVLHRTPSASKLGKHQFKVQPPKVLTTLPPSITITRTQRPNSGTPSAVASRVNKVSVNKGIAVRASTILKKDIDLARSVGDSLTVELDDEGSQSSTATASPQWYLRPEEQNENNLEMQNNKEPELINMIEITIEDSPVKPYLLKEVSNFNNELAIIIEDSPVKPFNEEPSDCGSDTEHNKIKSPQSKKKLCYSENYKSDTNETNTMEKNTDHPVNKDNEHEEEIVENFSGNENQQISPLNKQDIPGKFNMTATQKSLTGMFEKDKSVENDLQQNGNRVELIDTKNDIKNATENTDEFHPTYQRFIDLCFEIENSDDMSKIIEKKIKTYYRQVSRAYVESEEFLDMVSIKTLMMKTNPEKMFLYIKDIVDELNLQRKMAKSQGLVNSDKSIEEAENDILNDNDKYDRKRRRQIRKLEKTIKKLHRAIQKLEEQEVDFDDEEDSVYLLTERYKERLIRVHAKFCQITNTKMPSEPRIQIQSRYGQPSGPARKLEKLINKVVPIGKPRPFPDFHDVLKCVREANDEDKIGWNEADIIEEARDLFTRCGKSLQRRRQENEWRLAASRMTQDVDPAENNESLKKKLDENTIVASKKEIELFNKYADKQKQLQLVATEIGDKEADESSDNQADSEDDEVYDNSNSLESSQKRKNRLLRLLEEKYQKPTHETVRLPSGESKKNPEPVILLSQNNYDNVEFDKETNGIDRQIEINHKAEGKAKIENLNDIMLNPKNRDEPENLNMNKEDDEDEDKIKGTEAAKGKFVVLTTDDVKNVKNIDDDIKRGKPKQYNNERIYLISDESDGDELNLLQKLHSGNELSSPESSDCDDSPIAISDTLESNNESEDNENYDVISIENSSYSESETAKDDRSKNDTVMKTSTIDDDDVIAKVNEARNFNILEIERRNILVQEMENILLASSEDEVSKNNNEGSDNCGNTSSYLKDDAISISESHTDKVQNENIDKGEKEIIREVEYKKIDGENEIIHKVENNKIAENVSEILHDIENKKIDKVENVIIDEVENGIIDVVEKVNIDEVESMKKVEVNSENLYKTADETSDVEIMQKHANLNDKIYDYNLTHSQKDFEAPNEKLDDLQPEKVDCAQANPTTNLDSMDCVQSFATDGVQTSEIQQQILGESERMDVTQELGLPCDIECNIDSHNDIVSILEKSRSNDDNVSNITKNYSPQPKSPRTIELEIKTKSVEMLLEKMFNDAGN